MLDNIEDQEKSYYAFRPNVFIGQDSKRGSYLNYCPNQLHFDNENSSNNLHYSPIPIINIEKDSSINNSNNNIFGQQPGDLRHSSNLLPKYSIPERISYHSSQVSNNENKLLVDSESLDGNINNCNGSYYKDFLQKVFGDEHHLKKSIIFQNDENKDKNLKNLKKIKNKIRSRPKKLYSINYEERKNNNNICLNKERFSIKVKNKRKLSSVINLDKVNNTGTNCNNNYKQTISTGNNNNKQSNKNSGIKNYNDKKKYSVNSLKKKKPDGGESPNSQLNDINPSESNNNIHYHKGKLHNKNIWDWKRNKKSKKKFSKCLIKDEENVKNLSLKKININSNNKEVKSSTDNIKNNQIIEKEKENINGKNINDNIIGDINMNEKEKNNKKKKNKKRLFSFCSCCC